MLEDVPEGIDHSLGHQGGGDGRHHGLSLESDGEPPIVSRALLRAQVWPRTARRRAWHPVGATRGTLRPGGFAQHVAILLDRARPRC